MNARTFDELLDAEYGTTGTPEREKSLMRMQRLSAWLKRSEKNALELV